LYASLPTATTTPLEDFTSAVIDHSTISVQGSTDLPKVKSCSPTETAKGENQEDQHCAPSIESESLTRLIGELLTLKEERWQPRNPISSAASTCSSECVDIADSDDGIVESVISIGSSQKESCTLEPIAKDPIPKRTQKKNTSTKVQQQSWSCQYAPQAAQMQMAQYQMTQWPYAVQMAQWQQSAYAFHTFHANAYC